MLMTGSEYLESIRDGRRVYIGSERVDDVTTHPAFRNTAQTLATIYDRKRAPENREVMTCEGTERPSQARPQQFRNATIKNSRRWQETRDQALGSAHPGRSLA
jgi:aromatic ring hydroxylase